MANNVDLEDEFSKLVSGMHQAITIKLSNGEISLNEAQQLRDMIASRVTELKDDDSWCASQYSDNYDTSSEVYEEDGWYSSKC